MKAFLVTYDGLWLGGKAVVLAHSPEEALESVRSHPGTVCFDAGSTPAGMRPVRVAPTVREIPMSGVLYNDNGDY